MIPQKTIFPTAQPYTPRKMTVGSQLAQQAASQSLPHVVTTPPAVTTTGEVTQRRVAVTIAGASSQQLVIPGDFYFFEYISDPSNQWVFIKPEPGNVEYKAVIGEARKLRTPFTLLSIRNEFAQAVNLVLTVGYGEYNPAVVRCAPSRVTFEATAINTGAGAYAIGDAVTDDFKTIGVIPPGFNHAALTRFDFFVGSAVVTNADFLTYFFTQATTNSPVDNALWNLVFGDYPDVQAMVRSPSFVSQSALMSCLVADFQSPIHSYNGLEGINLYFQPVAMAAWNPGGIVDFAWRVTLELG